MKLTATMKITFFCMILPLIGLQYSCNEHPRKLDRNKLMPKIVKVGSTELYGKGTDTLRSGEIFEAILFTDIEEFYDSKGENIVLDRKIMKFKFSKGAEFNENDYKLFPVLVGEDNVGKIYVPADTILKYHREGLIAWQAHVLSIRNTLYITEGLWYVKR